MAKGKWMLKWKDVDFGLQWAEPMKDKLSSSVLVALQDGTHRMRQMASDENAKVARLHADDDSSFDAEVHYHFFWRFLRAFSIQNLDMDTGQELPQDKDWRA